MKIRKEITLFGTICYYNENNQLHREDGPAVEYECGIKRWYKNGLLHRLDGPATIWESPDCVDWYYQGKYINVISQKEFEKYIKLKAFL